MGSIVQAAGEMRADIDQARMLVREAADLMDKVGNTDRIRLSPHPLRVLAASGWQTAPTKFIGAQQATKNSHTSAKTLLCTVSVCTSMTTTASLSAPSSELCMMLAFALLKCSHRFSKQ